MGEMYVTVNDEHLKPSSTNARLARPLSRS
ncbi:hypothetical protein CSHISOI_10498 [Colletotrichum shisoi]|uniref:Uncharacterized protein n=1 Tax=Colletotrichum shisoi TaxID=2078593 RepID=A0A5Q4BEC7_9PEZI|nr:hypothetical protein CSHISOI_10498 [Colletotrichum shisoi]